MVPALEDRLAPKMAKLPNFFIVGAPKAGTTSLYHYLDQHPQIYMSPIKEPNYFATETRQENFDPALRCEIARETRGLREFLSGPMRERRIGGIVEDSSVRLAPWLLLATGAISAR